ncbi:hypothetical protein GGF31_007497 [Allomyces arbusculus]|nr:hypothetical protein GGF31_007497 [Allomyces arbusculus]
MKVMAKEAVAYAQHLTVKQHLLVNVFLEARSYMAIMFDDPVEDLVIADAVSPMRLTGNDANFVGQLLRPIIDKLALKPVSARMSPIKCRRNALIHWLKTGSYTSVLFRDRRNQDRTTAKVEELSTNVIATVNRAAWDIATAGAPPLRAPRMF